MRPPKSVRSSIVRTREDLEGALMFAGEGKVRTHFSTDRLENINAIFGAMGRGAIDGRIVVEFTEVGSNLPTPREIAARPSGGEAHRRAASLIRPCPTHQRALGSKKSHTVSGCSRQDGQEMEPVTS
jgi:hypothetical protein